MAYDLILKDGLIVDGTGKAGYLGSVAVQEGRIAAVGNVSGEAKRVIEANGQVIAPGFIDAHTHYDAQLFWDSAIDPATSHGITSILIGNCGFTLAPVRPEHRDYLLGVFSASEEVPKSVLLQHSPITWQSFAQYLSCMEQSKFGVNVLTQVGHSAIRYYVMGAESLEREASDDEIDQMVKLAEEAMDVGAAGVSTSFSPHHVDEAGGHIPSFYAGEKETLALAAAVGRKKRRLFSLNPQTKREGVLPEDRALLTKISEASGAVVTWNDLGAGSAGWLDVIEFMEGEIKQGRRIQVVARCQPAETRFLLKQLSPLNSGNRAWLDFTALPEEKKLAAIQEPDRRAALSAFWRSLRYFRLAHVEKVVSPKFKHLEGRRLIDIAAERGVDAVDLMFDIAIEDKLETFFILMEEIGEDESAAERLLKSPAALIGISDGGAHLQTFAGADFPTYFLKHWVREKHTFTLEQGVAALTSVAAEFIGLKDRGTLEPGKAADLVIFDPDKVAPAALESLDFPGGGTRLRKGAHGIPWVVVNGVPIVENGKATGAAPGRLIRA